MFVFTKHKAISQIYNFQEADEGEEMEFHLLYQGPLRAESRSSSGPHGRATDKQCLRKHFHPQLRELWQLDPELRNQADRIVGRREKPGGGFEYFPESLAASPEQTKPFLDWIADDYQRCNGRFIPLVSEAGGFTCSLDILFLRRDNPGSLIQSGGDIDNRIKVLLDGLRMPKSVPELGGIPLDENPFFCLLEDDSLITKLSVTTDRLITPSSGADGINDVFLDICVKVVNPSAIFAGGRLV